MVEADTPPQLTMSYFVVDPMGRESPIANSLYTERLGGGVASEERLLEQNQPANVMTPNIPKIRRMVPPSIGPPLSQYTLHGRCAVFVAHENENFKERKHAASPGFE